MTEITLAGRGYRVGLRGYNMLSNIKKHHRLFKLCRSFYFWAMQNTLFRVSGKIKTYLLLQMNKHKKGRKLEIGPGNYRIPGFETLDILPGLHIDYVLNAVGKLPFPDGTFETIYASHILEHVPWYQLDRVLREWVRILKVGGFLEIWVPDGLKICKAFVDAELLNADTYKEDGWYKFNEEKDPCKWANGRIFTYGDGKGKTNHPNWHRALFSPRYLEIIMEGAGLKEVRLLKPSEIRSHDHGWINLGMTGKK